MVEGKKNNNSKYNTYSMHCNGMNYPTYEPTHKPTHEPTHKPTHEPMHCNNGMNYDPTYEPTHKPAPTFIDPYHNIPHMGMSYIYIKL